MTPSPSDDTGSGLESVHAEHARKVVAPDGSRVRILSAADRASMITAKLGPGEVSKAVCHRTVDELWYCLHGEGRIWRFRDGQEKVTLLEPGQSVNLPAGATFQFRCDGGIPLEVLIVTAPPWPGDGEAAPSEGPWVPTS